MIFRNDKHGGLAGFQSWKKFGRHVKKGEKGIKVIAPTPFKKTVEEDGEEKEVVVPRYKVVSTYDVSQTEGKPLPEIASTLTGSVDSYDDLMAALAQVSPVPIGFEDISGSAYGYYSTMEKRIAVREGMSQQQTLKTLVHEISHAKLHDVGLSKPKDERPQIDRQTMECQAEAIAFVCCERFGLDTSDYSFGYIAGWSSGRELKELRSSLEIIRDTAAEIIDSVEDCLQKCGMTLNRKKNIPRRLWQCRVKPWQNSSRNSGTSSPAPAIPGAGTPST